MRGWMGGWVVALAIGAIVSGARADGIRHWRTPDGSLYFGDAPPAGSTYVGDVPKLGTVGDGWVPKERPTPVEPTPAPAVTPHEARAIDHEIRGTWKGMTDALGGRPRPE